MWTLFLSSARRLSNMWNMSRKCFNICEGKASNWNEVSPLPERGEISGSYAIIIWLQSGSSRYPGGYCVKSSDIDNSTRSETAPRFAWVCITGSISLISATEWTWREHNRKEKGESEDEAEEERPTIFQASSGMALGLESIRSCW
jgi:hypothetical protein